MRTLCAIIEVSVFLAFRIASVFLDNSNTSTIFDIARTSSYRANVKSLQQFKEKHFQNLVLRTLNVF